jgi:hypothetical protein
LDAIDELMMLMTALVVIDVVAEAVVEEDYEGYSLSFDESKELV